MDLAEATCRTDISLAGFMTDDVVDRTAGGLLGNEVPEIGAVAKGGAKV